MNYFLDTEFFDTGTTINLISIGIVAEDGREFYRVAEEKTWGDVSNWIRENIVPHLSEHKRSTREQMRRDLLGFIGNDRPYFWAWYGSYDWVAMCQLFGRMLDLPTGWPRYVNELKQLCKTKGDPGLPKQGLIHNALEDARWNKTIYEFLTK